MKQFIFPDAAQSIAALSSSLLNHYGIPSKNQGYPPVDGLLYGAPRNIVLLLLDGLGQNILTRHLPETSFLRQHQVATLSSVFPPTTTAAATALETGLFPSQSGWLGWSIFWPPLEKNVALYPNTTEDGQQAAAYHIGENCLRVTQLAQLIRKKGDVSACSISEQGDIDAKTLEEVLAAVCRVCREPGSHFVYAYVNEPDHTLHRSGCFADAVTQWLLKANSALEQLQQNCPDTLFLLTADHGFIDVNPLCLEDFPELEDTLLRKPSIEPRALNLFLKPGREQDFLRFWGEIIGDSYTLYTKAQVLEHGLFGPRPYHPMLQEILGDYLAVANTPMTMFPNHSYMKFMKATHVCMTPEELTVPLIIWESKEKIFD